MILGHVWPIDLPNMKEKKRIALVAGTRPEVIKLAPVFYALSDTPDLEPVMISTGQHREMLDQALTVFQLKAAIDLEVMQPGQTLPDLTARVLTRTTSVLKELRPAAILLQGDTTTVLAAALAAFYEGIPVGHVEAGLRTGNMRSPFPEEMNRRLTTPLATWNFCPTLGARENLLRENVSPGSCHVTGNTVIDALLGVRSRLRQQEVRWQDLADRIGITPAFAERFLGYTQKRWLLITGHRRESFGAGFEQICAAINALTTAFPDLGVVYPVHLNPRVQEPVRRLLGNNPQVALAAPAGYEDFIWLLDRCHFVLSDSGGVQEEAPSLGKPVLVLRDTTERPEGVEAGTSRLVGTDPVKILKESTILLNDAQEYRRRSALVNPFGDGTASHQITKLLRRALGGA